MKERKYKRNSGMNVVIKAGNYKKHGPCKCFPQVLGLGLEVWAMLHIHKFRKMTMTCRKESVYWFVHTSLLLAVAPSLL